MDKNREIPVLEFQLRHYGQTLVSSMMARHEDIEGYLQKAVDEVVSNAGDIVIQKAKEECINKLNKAVENYFRWGEGAKALENAVEMGLTPIKNALIKANTTE